MTAGGRCIQDIKHRTMKTRIGINYKEEDKFKANMLLISHTRAVNYTEELINNYLSSVTLYMIKTKSIESWSVIKGNKQRMETCDIGVRGVMKEN